MDAGGNIAAAYSVSSSSMLPGIRYAGRLLSDPLGTLGAETTLVQGAGAEVGTYRWGDYSSLSLDPSDDCTFWYTNEYFKTNGTSWSTRIGSFKFPSCGTAQSVTFSKMDLLFAGQPLNHASSSQSVTLRNQQSAALNVSSVAVSGDYSETDNCKPQVPANGSCTISVTFTPKAGGLRYGSITVSDDASNSPQVLNLSGNGQASTVTLSATKLSFTNQLLGTTSASKILTLTNAGPSTLSFSSLALSGTNASDFAETNTCVSSSPLAVSATCTATITFTPHAIATRTATLAINDTGNASPQTVSLTGVGTIVKFTPTAITFGTQVVGTTSSTKSVTVSNSSSSASLSITSVSVAGANPADFKMTNTCLNVTVPPAGSCTISVSFAPTAIGTRVATVTIADDGGGSPQSVSLTGPGTIAQLSTSALVFSSQAVGTKSSGKTVTLKNTSASAGLAISSVSISGTNLADFTQSNNCSGVTLSPGASCTVTVSFGPKATGGRAATLNIYENGGGSPRTVSLSGTGA
jgi:hypothetical protein